MTQKNAPKKRRPKLLEQILQMFKALQVIKGFSASFVVKYLKSFIFKAYQWSKDEEKSIFVDCIWPLFQPDETSEGEEKIGRICYLAKIINLFNLWMSLEQVTFG